MSTRDLRLIDAHSHVNFNAYKDDAEEVIARALEEGIGMFAVGSQIDTSRRAITYADAHDGIWAVVGLHPVHLYEQYVDDDEVVFKSREEHFDRAAYEELARSSPKVVAIGECGMDLYRVPEHLPVEEVRATQREAFRAQVELAVDLDLPVMIHCRNAHADVAEVLEDLAAQGKKARGDIHCFTGTVAEAERYLDLGFFISFTGIITFPPRRSEIANGETLMDVVTKVPLDRLLVETDAPYLAPVPFRGKRNEPLFVRHVAERVAEIKGLAPDEVEKQTLKNTKELFGLDL